MKKSEAVRLLAIIVYIIVVISMVCSAGCGSIKPVKIVHPDAGFGDKYAPDIYTPPLEGRYSTWDWTHTGDGCDAYYKGHTYYPERYRDVEGIRELELKKGWWVPETELLLSLDCYTINREHE